MMITTVTSPHSASTTIFAARRSAASARPSGSRACAPSTARGRSGTAPNSRPGKDAGEEQMRDRDRAAGGERVDHRVVRRRDQQRLHRAADRDVGGEHARVARLDHLRDHHRADRRRVGDRRARDAAEERAGEDVDQREAAANERRRRRCARLTRRVAMPPSAMMAPASTKNGIASSAKSSVPSEILQHHRLERHVDPERARRARRARARRRPARRARTAARTLPSRTRMSMSTRAPRRWSRYMIDVCGGCRPTRARSGRAA